MIDLHLLRDEATRQRTEMLIARKDPSYDVASLVRCDAQVRQLRREVELLSNERNQLATEFSRGAPSEADKERARLLHARIKEQEASLRIQEEQFRELYLCCPNIPDTDLPVGNKEANQVVKVVGKKPSFDFTPHHHVALNEHLQWFDFAAGARMASSQFVLYRSEGARLIYALTLLMMQHNQRRGYSLVMPPYVVNEQALEGACQFPKFRDAVYAVSADKLYLTPTAEVNLTALYRDHHFSIAELPVRMAAWTSCFRREAGTYGATERGLIRIHQFEKVELYTIATPEQAVAEHERMLACAEELLQLLGLHYRVSLLAAQDASFAAAKTYDIEVWMPGQGEYKEVSSASSCSDFQARRCNMRYRVPGASKGSSFVHTLNASSLAVPRLIVALMETYQQHDGTIQLPPVLERIVWEL